MERKYSYRTLLFFSILDLAFGILSMILEPIEWQLCSLFSSIITLFVLIAILIFNVGDLKHNTLTIIISLCDIITGCISVALAIYTIKALVLTFSTMKAFKIGKISIQSGKALQLTQATTPILKKITIKASPIILSVGSKFIKSIRGKNKMAENEVEQVSSETKVDSKAKIFFENLFAYLKRNLKTNTSTVSNIITSLCSGTLVGGGLYVGEVDIPVYANCIIGFIVSVVLFILNEIGIKGRGTETQEEYDAAEAKIAEEKEEAKKKKEADAKAKQKAEEKQKEINEIKAIYNAKKAEEDAQAKKIALEQKAIVEMQLFNDAVANGTFSGTFEEWLVK